MVTESSHGSVPALCALALQLKEWGANVVAIERGARIPTHPWKQWFSDIQEARHIEGLPWHGADRVGIVNGPGDWRSFDFDKCLNHEPVRILLEALGLPATYPWVEQSDSGAGYHVWIRCHDDPPLGALPSKHTHGEGDEPGIFKASGRDGLFDHLELRWRRNQTVVAASKDPRRWMHGAPEAPPAEVKIDAVVCAFSAVTLRAAYKESARARITRITPINGDEQKTRIRQTFDMVAFAEMRWGNVREEGNCEFRVMGQGGLLINLDKGLWYHFTGELGGDCFDLVGYALRGVQWNRRDPGMFRQALAEAAAFAGVALTERSTGPTPIRFEVQPAANLTGPAGSTGWDQFLMNRVSLADVIENGIEPQEYLIAPVLLKGKVHCIFGGPEQGKTMILLHLVLQALQAGKRVLMLDEEVGQQGTAERLAAMGATRDDLERLYYFQFQLDGSLDAMAATIIEGVQRERIDLVTLDSISKALAAAGLDENSNTDCTKFMRAWVTPAAGLYGATVVFLDHVAKAEDDGRYSRGASSKLADTDVQWHIQATVPPPRTSLGRIVLAKEKDRWATVPDTVRFIAGGDGTGTIAVRLEGSEHVTPSPVDEALWATITALKDCGQTGYTAWARAAGMIDSKGKPTTTFDRHIERLKGVGHVMKLNGQYVVTVEGARAYPVDAESATYSDIEATPTCPHMSPAGGDGGDQSLPPPPPPPYRVGVMGVDSEGMAEWREAAGTRQMPPVTMFDAAAGAAGDTESDDTQTRIIGDNELAYFMQEEAAND